MFSNLTARYLCNRQKQKLQREELLLQWQEIAKACAKANQELESLFSQNRYIDRQSKQAWKSAAACLKERIRQTQPCKKDSAKQRIVDRFLLNCSSLDQQCRTHNSKFIAEERKLYPALASIEGRALNDQQWECVVNNEDNHLVVAGPGCGKTMTIIAKVKYLLTRLNCQPQELLILSNTEVSAKHLTERLSTEIGRELNVKTLGQVGMEIIAGAEGLRPSITSIDVAQFVEEQYDALGKTTHYQDLINSYLLSFQKQYQSPFSFKSQGEYLDYLQDNDITSLRGEKVKSYAEMEIANFLYTNNVQYSYEKQYRPYFHIPGHNICIEHFSIDKNGDVPAYFPDSDNLSAKEIYHQDISRRNNLYKNKGTILVATYSHEMGEGVLIEYLRAKLLANHVHLEPMSREELSSLLDTGDASDITPLSTAFINQLRANYLFLDAVRAANKEYTGYQQRRNEAFLSLVIPIYLSYTAQLKENGELDTNDILKLATEYVSSKRTPIDYNYIIVDQCQDMSNSQYKLLAAIREKNAAKLFCVGDDWQATTRSSGSDISYLTRYQEYFGFTARSYLETTYTLPPGIIELSSKFILKNPAQIKKQLHSALPGTTTAFALVYGTPSSLDKQLKLKLDSLPENSTVLLLGRHRQDIEPYTGNQLTYQQGHPDSVIYSQRRDLQIQYSTVHDSRGLKAEYVFILSNQRGRFPSDIGEDQVLNLVLQNQEKYPYAEDRRLFYVGLTRATKYVYLMVNKDCKSVFIQEIEEDYPSKTANKKQENSLPEYMIQRQNRFGVAGCARSSKAF